MLTQYQPQLRACYHKIHGAYFSPRFFNIIISMKMDLVEVIHRKEFEARAQRFLSNSDFQPQICAFCKIGQMNIFIMMSTICVQNIFMVF